MGLDNLVDDEGGSTAPVKKSYDEMSTTDVQHIIKDIPEEHKEFFKQNPVPERHGRGKQSHAQKRKYIQHLNFFCNVLKNIQENELESKIMRRSWCYYLEGKGYVSKGNFDHVERQIDRGRKIGLLPMKFLNDDDACDWANFPNVTDAPDEEEWVENQLNSLYQKYPGSDFWIDKDYFMIMLVEKIDLKDTVYGPICDKYHIPIANARGWSNITTRGYIIDFFDEAWSRDQSPVILYAGDFDPTGLFMGSEDQLKKNIREYRLKPWLDEMEHIRVGINEDFIQEHDISWIENLESASGKPADTSKSWVSNYVQQHGRRKVEANALITSDVRGDAQEEFEEILDDYIGKDAPLKYNRQKLEEQKEVEEMIDDVVDFENL